MARNDDDFRLRPGKIRDRGGRPMPGRRPLRARPSTFMGEVHQAIRRAGGNPARLAGTGKESGRFNARGRGGSAALALKGRSAWSRDGSGARTRARRVAVKARIVKLNPQRGASRGRQFVSAKAVDAHLRYLRRDGVTRDGEKGQLYSAERNVEDGRAFLERGGEDRHQFRFIVSAEESVELADLRETTRSLMKQMEADLGTRLDWVAVDHHNTGHPHTHIVVRGITEDGKTLNIAGDYIAHGVRERASEIVTLELGRQTEQEVARGLERDVDAERFTRLDRMLIENVPTRLLDLRPDTGQLRANLDKTLLIGRLKTLERFRLAREVQPGIWSFSERLESTMRELGERGDIIKAMNRALSARGEDRAIGSYVLHGAVPDEPVIGQVIGKRLDDELGDRIGLLIDGVDGRVHHVTFEGNGEAPGHGSIVQVGRVATGPRPADRNIASLAHDHDGTYRPSEHRALAESGLVRVPGGDHDRYVRSHVRRLEALRRAGIVERIDADHWRIPDDFEQRAAGYDARRGVNNAVCVLTTLDLEQQIGSNGATWLDRELVSPNRTPLAVVGFGREVSLAMEKRKQALVDMGYSTDLGGGRVSAPKDLIQRLEAVEVERTGRALAAQRGRDWQPAVAGNYVSGQLVGSTQLASGRFAMIDDGLGFSLVPWRPALEQQIGRHVSGVAMPGGDVDWSFGRKRGLGL